MNHALIQQEINAQQHCHSHVGQKDQEPRAHADARVGIICPRMLPQDLQTAVASGREARGRGRAKRVTPSSPSSQLGNFVPDESHIFLFQNH